MEDRYQGRARSQSEGMHGKGERRQQNETFRTKKFGAKSCSQVHPSNKVENERQRKQPAYLAFENHM